MENGVFLSPTNGNIIASGTISADSIRVNSPNNAYFGNKSLPNVISQYAPEPDLSEYYKKNETSSNTELNTKFNGLSTYIQTKNKLSSDGYLTQHQSLDDYYKKNETSSAVQIEEAFENRVSKTSIIVWSE